MTRPAKRSIQGVDFVVYHIGGFDIIYNVFEWHVSTVHTQDPIESSRTGKWLFLTFRQGRGRFARLR